MSKREPERARLSKRERERVRKSEKERERETFSPWTRGACQEEGRKALASTKWIYISPLLPSLSLARAFLCAFPLAVALLVSPTPHRLFCPKISFVASSLFNKIKERESHCRGLEMTPNIRCALLRGESGRFLAHPIPYALRRRTAWALFILDTMGGLLPWRLF